MVEPDAVTLENNNLEQDIDKIRILKVVLERVQKECIIESKRNDESSHILTALGNLGSTACEHHLGSNKLGQKSSLPEKTFKQ